MNAFVIVFITRINTYS